MKRKKAREKALFAPTRLLGLDTDSRKKATKGCGKSRPNDSLEEEIGGSRDRRCDSRDEADPILPPFTHKMCENWLINLSLFSPFQLSLYLFAVSFALFSVFLFSSFHIQKVAEFLPLVSDKRYQN